MIKKKLCSSCKKRKQITSFYKCRGACKVCRINYVRNYYKKIKELIFTHYGTQCACCHESALEFLCIDHINGKGNEHRRAIGAGTNFYSWLIKNNLPSGFRTLCHNCNMSLGSFGYCPHGNISRSK